MACRVPCHALCLGYPNQAHRRDVQAEALMTGASIAMVPVGPPPAIKRNILHHPHLRIIVIFHVSLQEVHPSPGQDLLGMGQEEKWRERQYGGS